jgi:hypothetical protein
MGITIDPDKVERHGQFLHGFIQQVLSDVNSAKLTSRLVGESERSAEMAIVEGRLQALDIAMHRRADLGTDSQIANVVAKALLPAIRQIIAPLDVTGERCAALEGLDPLLPGGVALAVEALAACEQWLVEMIAVIVGEPLVPSTSDEYYDDSAKALVGATAINVRLIPVRQRDPVVAVAWQVVFNAWRMCCCAEPAAARRDSRALRMWSPRYSLDIAGQCCGEAMTELGRFANWDDMAMALMRSIYIAAGCSQRLRENRPTRSTDD